jgi:hypothetical protein
MTVNRDFRPAATAMDELVELLCQVLMDGPVLHADLPDRDVPHATRTGLPSSSQRANVS